MDAADNWTNHYRDNFGSYKACAEKLESLMHDLLDDAGIDAVSIESRAKDPHSLQRKVEGKKDAYPDPLDDVTDLVGVRIIAYYLEDVERISHLLESEFVVDAANSMDKLDDLEPDRFGYRSVHFIVTLPKKREKLAEWGVFRGKRAEIQLRTATQHAWAAVEHKLSYKRTREAPRDLRRRLLRLSALFELADEQFSRVRRQLEEVEAQYGDDVRGGNLELPVDNASLEAFIAENEVVDELVADAQAAGFKVADRDSENYEADRAGDLRDLTSILDQLDVSTLAELDAILSDRSGMAAAVKGIATDAGFSKFRWRSPVDVLTILILYRQRADLEVVGSIYRDKMVDAFRSAFAS